MDNARQIILENNGKKVVVSAVNFSSAGNFNDFQLLLEPIFTELCPYLKESVHSFYVRNIQDWTIEGKYIAGNAYTKNEITGVVPSWPANEPELIDAFAHELHHIVRWQNGGYGETLGGAITSEGAALLYAHEKSGWDAPWANTPISSEAIQRLKQEWDKKQYNHDYWFYESDLGKWVGYTIAYKLIASYLKNGFDLKRSVDVKENDLFPLLEAIMNES